MQPKMTRQDDPIYNYSSLKSIQMTGRNLTVLIHSASNVDDVTRDLWLISSTPLSTIAPQPANIA